MTISEQYVWFITGTSRGIGLEMTRQLLQSASNTVVAACRTPSEATELQGLASSAAGKLHIVSLDVTSPQSVRKCATDVADIVGDKGIDYLINNAGINVGDQDKAFSLDLDNLQVNFTTNVAGPVCIAQNFVHLVEKSRKKTIANISSSLGSVGIDYGPVHASYAMTKAALNMLTYKQSKERPDLTAVSICPGWLKTDMGSQNATYPVSVGVEGVLKVVSSLTPANSGQFINFRGEQVPW